MEGQKTEVGPERAAPIEAGPERAADSGDLATTFPGFLSLAVADPWRIGPPAVAALQRTVGNRAVVDVLQRQRAGGAELPPPTNDEIVAEIGSTLGGPFASYQAFADSMTAGTFLGHRIARGVRPEFLEKLTRAEGTIDDEFLMSGRRRPPNNGITEISGFRHSKGFHGWGIAIDIDVARNPYVMHEAGDAQIDAQVGPAYHNIARTILNQPIGDQQSIIPQLLRHDQPLTSGGPTGRRGRAGEYFDRLQLESDAMKRYFELMNDQAKLTAFLATEWAQIHPNEPAPAAADLTRQMWQDFAALGGAVPRGGPAGVPGYTPPGAVRGGDRPFRPNSVGQQDPGQGFMTIPREVVLGLSQELSRWGAIDFPNARSGDIQHFDDGNGLGNAISSAKRAAAARIRARAAAAAAAPAPTVTPTLIQRRTEPGEGSSKGGVYRPSAPALAGPAPLTPEQRLSGPHWKQIADDRWGGGTPNIDELKADFAADVKAFIAMLAANNITVTPTSAFRPVQRSYLFYCCSQIAFGGMAPKDAPKMDGVDIIWDHGDLTASRTAATELAKMFEIGKVAALRSNHNGGTAIDMTMNFNGNSKNEITYEHNGKTVTRKIKVDDEARDNEKNLKKTISGISKRELSKAGADFGLKRAIDNDIVHWSRTGR